MSKKGQEEGPETWGTTLLAVIVVLLVLTIGGAIWKAAFGGPQPSPGTKNTYVSFAQILHYMEDEKLVEKLPFTPCSLQIEVSGGLALIGFDKGVQNIRVKQTLFDHKVNRPAACGTTGACLLLCDSSDGLDSVVDSEDCKQEKRKGMDVFEHVKTFRLNNKFLVYTGAEGFSQRSAENYKLEITGKNPNLQAALTKSSENLQSCFRVRDQYEAEKSKLASKFAQA